MTNHQKIQKTMLSAAEVAGNFLKYKFYRKEFNVSKKKDKSFVTDVDFSSQNIIVTSLSKSFPNIPIVSEEFSTKENNENLQNDCFIIDPLDATKNFICGIPHFDISIAYIENSQPIIGVVYNPVLNYLYFASKGSGAFFNNKKIETVKCKTLELANLNVNIHKLPKEKYFKIINATYGKTKSIRHFGNAVVETCMIANGTIDGLINQYLSLWDFAACSLILEEAGGIVTNLEGKSLNYQSLEKETLLAVGDLSLHEKLLNDINI